MPEDEEAAAQPGQTPCAACRTLRRRCVPSCIFAPYFPAEDDDPSRFAAIHRVFGASNAARMLADVDLPDDRRRAAETLVEEAMARVRDPAFGCVSLHAILLMLNQDAREQVSALREEIARELGGDAAAEPVDVVVDASPEVKTAAKEMVERALTDARKKDAELLDERRAVDLEWSQQDRCAARRAGEGRHRVLAAGDKHMAETEDTAAAAAAAAGESSSEKTVWQAAAAGDEHRHLAALHAGAEPGIPEGNLHKQSAAAEEAAREEEEELASEQAAAAEVQRHESATKQLGAAEAGSSCYLDVAAAEELAKKLDMVIEKFAAAQQYDDPAAARHASFGGLDVTPPGQPPPPQPRDMEQQVAEAQEEEEAGAVEAASDQSLTMMLTQQFAAEAAAAAAEQGMVIHLLAKQYDDHDTELDNTMAYGHPDLHQQMVQQTTEAQLAAAAFAAGEISGEQGLNMPHAAAAELVRQGMMMQYAQTELDITLGHGHHHQPGLSQEIVVQQLAAATAPLAMEQDMMQEVAAAELAREQALIIHNVATAELAREQAMMMQQNKQPEEEMSLLLEAAAALQRPVPMAAQYTGTGLDISPGHHQLTVQQMLQVAMEPNATTMQQGAEHGCATVALQTPGSGEAASFLVGQQPPPQEKTETATALGLQLDPSLLPELAQTTAHVQPPPQQSTDGGDEGQDSDFTSILYH